MNPSLGEVETNSIKVQDGEQQGSLCTLLKVPKIIKEGGIE